MQPSYLPALSQLRAHTHSGKDLWIVVIGRGNIAKSSRALEQMIRDLRASGLSVQNLEQRHVATSRLMNSWFDTLGGGRIAAFSARHGRPGRWLRLALKAVWLLWHPSRWDFSRFVKKKTNNEERAADLRALLRYWRRYYPSRHVHLFAHSAGGIVSSWLAHEPNVASLVCFGYPFKHPKAPEEAFRTAHLASLRKPLLIFQGDRDEYGAEEKARQYDLSPGIRLVPISADHNYDPLGPDLYRQCLEEVAQHICVATAQDGGAT